MAGMSRRSTVGETELENDPRAGRADDAARLSEQLADERRLTCWLSNIVWRREDDLRKAREAAAAAEREVAAMLASTSWRATSPLRAIARLRVASRAGPRRTALARFPHRVAKVVYWSATLQLRPRLRDRRQRIAVERRRELEGRKRSYARWVAEYDTLTDADIDAMRGLDRALTYRPLVSVVMPVFNSTEGFLREAIESMRAQVYENWELCIADDGSSMPRVRQVLDEYEERDKRIRVVYRSERGGISAASNSGLELAKGELVGFLDHDDVLRPHALLLVVHAFGEAPDASYVYSDEDKIDEAGRRFSHYFKPDWNPTLLLSQNYLCHFSVVRTDLVRRVGGFRSEFDGSQDWDLALRISEVAPPNGIVHVPHVLYHWRAVPGSAAAGIEAKPYAIDAARRATEDHLRRIGRSGYIAPVGDHQSVRFFVPPPRPVVTAIVPSTGRRDLLEPCLSGLLDRTDYDELEIIVAVSETAADDDSTRRILERAAGDPRVRIMRYPPRPFNHPWTVNRAAASARGDLLLMLNDDTRVIRDDWLEIMVGHALQDHVGAVGGLLLYPDDTVQHAGMLVGARGVAEHLYAGRSADVSGYANRARVPQDLSVVAGTCVLVRREAFDELHGLDESFPVCYADIDFCLRLRQLGWRVVYVPDAALYHLESASFGSHQDGREDEHRRDDERMRQRWGHVLLDDPMHSPNLELNAASPGELAFPPRVSYPWRSQLSANRVGASSSSSEPANR
jgi:O-antigen biosynthesis protein